MIRVELPPALRALAGLEREVQLDLPAPVTTRAVLEALESRHPVLRGAIRDFGTERRRPLLRFYACRQDWSHEPLDTPLPDAVARGEEPFLVVGAISGG